MSRFHIEKIIPEVWEQTYSHDAHQICFDKVMPPGNDRIDFALLCIDQNSKLPAAYATCREYDAETLYLKHGGAFPSVKDTVLSFASYKAILQWTEGKYKRLSTLIENTNTVYLKMAITVGFVPIGMRTFEGSILLEFIRENNSCGH